LKQLQLPAATPEAVVASDLCHNETIEINNINFMLIRIIKR
jgi:hypothetical protein